jgi:hypothetical protein
MALCREFRGSSAHWPPPPARCGSTASASALLAAAALARLLDFGPFPAFPSSRSSSSVLSSFGPSLHRRCPASSLLRPLLTSARLATGRSPQVRRCLFPFAPPGSTVRVSDDCWASLLPASLPPAPGLAAGSCSCGRRFATRFFQLRLAATPCVSLRLASSPPSSTFQLVRHSPCWAHWRRRPRLPGRESSRPSKVGSTADSASLAACATRGSQGFIVRGRNPVLRPCADPPEPAS